MAASKRFLRSRAAGTGCSWAASARSGRVAEPDRLGAPGPAAQRRGTAAHRRRPERELGALRAADEQYNQEARGGEGGEGDQRGRAGQHGERQLEQRVHGGPLPSTTRVAKPVLCRSSPIRPQSRPNGFVAPCYLPLGVGLLLAGLVTARWAVTWFDERPTSRRADPGAAPAVRRPVVDARARAGLGHGG